MIASINSWHVQNIFSWIIRFKLLLPKPVADFDKFPWWFADMDRTSNFFFPIRNTKLILSKPNMFVLFLYFWSFFFWNASSDRTKVCVCVSSGSSSFDYSILQLKLFINTWCHLCKKGNIRRKTRSLVFKDVCWVPTFSW